MISILKSLLVTFRHLFRPKVTVPYPEQQPPIPERYRGMHVYDVDRCIGCKLCQTHCPDTNNCIKITTTEKTGAANELGSGKKNITAFSIDYAVCSFCGICTEVCPTNCLQMSTYAVVSTTNKESLVRDLLQEGMCYREHLPRAPLHTSQQTKDTYRA